MIKMREEEIQGKTYYLRSYHKYRVYGQKNPNFDKFSGFILDLKDPRSTRHVNAVQLFGNMLLKVLPDIFDEDDSFCVAIVPSHNAGVLSDGLRSVVRHIKPHYRILNAKNPLIRTRTIDKLACGGRRDIDVHLESIDVVAPESVNGNIVLLLDDVTTTGNSIEACRQKLEQAGAKLVVAIAIAKTADDD